MHTYTHLTCLSVDELKSVLKFQVQDDNGMFVFITPDSLVPEISNMLAPLRTPTAIVHNFNPDTEIITLRQSLRMDPDCIVFINVSDENHDVLDVAYETGHNVIEATLL